MCVWAVLNCSVMFTFCNTMNYSRFLLSMGFSSKNTGVGCHVLLQGIFPTQELNPHLLHWWWILRH